MGVLKLRPHRHWRLKRLLFLQRTSCAPHPGICGLSGVYCICLRCKLEFKILKLSKGTKAIALVSKQFWPNLKVGRFRHKCKQHGVLLAVQLVPAAYLFPNSRYGPFRFRLSHCLLSQHILTGTIFKLLKKSEKNSK